MVAMTERTVTEKKKEKKYPFNPINRTFPETCFKILKVTSIQVKKDGRKNVSSQKKMLKEKNVCGINHFHFPAKQGHFVGLQCGDYFQEMKRRKKTLWLF